MEPKNAKECDKRISSKLHMIKIFLIVTTNKNSYGHY